ncbi:L-histidine N(alpha)-methyltransferase [Croceimicrobium sp.]|uniref:L-histidine N(alpha)-methyltransferase n=1 Tax=Croceimicrobium sp. TaxID=2828340 RepID=UPI003BA93848
MTPFKKDVIDLFSGKRGGHVEKWLYSDTPRLSKSGSQLWHEFIKTHPDYYVLSNEIALIQRSAKAIGKNLKNVDTLVDFGVGDGQALNQKVIPLLNTMRGIKTYVGIDLSEDFLKAAQSDLKSHKPELNLVSINGDFFHEKLDLPGIKRMGLMLGSTITNLELKEGEEFPHARIVKRLKHLKSMLGQGNHFLPSFDANEDVPSIQKAYNSPIWSEFVTGIMYDVDKIAYGDFSPKAWTHEMIWNSKAHALQHCATSTANQNFSFNEREFRILKGQRFVTVNTFKYPQSVFTSMAEGAGCEIEEYFVDRQARICLPDLVC